ncbi:HPP family protein [Geomesophilobacter sediminis]|uniref:HPP family protein n=1 Tax=Geomesophilobacter sediminis TaxID=2798584 RepID=A0A8J7JFG7_9BACT|nr:HPP family protein [Geomesophilobacter sediminis]MBJ6725049.1 HPP family protein [Geomesophilobacter sediminis]
MRQRLVRVPVKMKGKLRGERAPLSKKYAVWGVLSGTASILAIFAVTQLAGCPLLIGSFGASAVLLFGAAESPLAQPRNLIGGHLVSALVAVVTVLAGGTDAVAVSLAVGVSIGLMYLTRTVHPPGGATALIGVQSHATPAFLLMPVLSGSLLLLLVALFTNNVVHHRQYPKHWI